MLTRIMLEDLFRVTFAAKWSFDVPSWHCIVFLDYRTLTNSAFFNFSQAK